MASDTDLDQIWSGDLFGRRDEAGLLIGYLESIYGRPQLREDAHGFTLAVDGRYGEGKSFFLRRLAEQLALDHPVAFIDAWTDDLADEPLTALAATLKRALDPLIEASPEIQRPLKDFFEKSGRVAKIIGSGLVKRGVGLAITAGAAEILADVLLGAETDVADAVKETVKSSGKDLVEDGVKALDSVAPGKLMEGRIAEFELGQEAIEDMRASLASLVASLGETNFVAPIFIIIDELDRCRPTYAVKLLEQIKHLFDVQGLVFVLGLHGEQLAHSVTAAYGAQFDGQAYLRRFFHRQYRLAEPDLKPLVDHLVQQTGLPSDKFNMLPVISAREKRTMLQPADMVARYMALYGLSARNAFEVVDILQTCVALVGDKPIYLHYLMPLIVGHIQGIPEGTLPVARQPISWSLFEPSDHFGTNGEARAPDKLAESFHKVCASPREQLAQQAHSDWPAYDVNAVYETSVNQPTAISAVANYPRLLTTVTRFKNPQIDN